MAKVYYDKDNKYLSQEILIAGWGWWYHYFSKDESLGDLEKQSRHQKKGLWKDSNAMAPWEFRKIERLINSENE